MAGLRGDRNQAGGGQGFQVVRPPGSECRPGLAGQKEASE
jgi:hypothetical protein